MGLVSTVLIALAPAGCKKDSGPPSPEYEQAHQRFSKIYAQKLDQAFLDPEMDAIDALLEQVPADSMDAPSAKELQQRIKAGRAKMEAAQEEQQEAIESAHQVDSVPSSPEPEAEPEPTPPPAEPKDAGTPDLGPVAGSPASELTAGYLGCFQAGKPIDIQGKGLRDAWEMSSRARCSQQYPAFVGQVVLVEDGKVLAMLPKSAIVTTYKLQDGGTSTGNPNTEKSPGPTK
ncbi:hypothetical protein [Hyalangium versicolor]|uniref:hypothetical protein n=1 Tax=Hyalangium versicolor TaxID=2861190 RepID=UPI001CCB861A|nr:hypothetical protein [Hyalangium versicolor]